MLTKVSDTFRKVYEENNDADIIEKISEKEFLSRLFCYYHYYSGDDSYLAELEDIQFKNNFVQAIAEPNDEQVAFDIIVVISKNDDIEMKLKETDYFLAEIISGINKYETREILSFFKQNKVDINTKLRVVFLVDKLPIVQDKSFYKELVSNFNGSMTNLQQVIFFADDIIEIVEDIVTPTPYVSHGILQISGNNNYLIHGEEKSLVISIYAKSLKELYEKYSTKGLFASNLRYYVKSAKIDSAIKTTILAESDHFWYFNNGLIITCSDYKLDNDKLELKNFSIVNGGQTTNLIGNTNIENDFPLLCKIIKNKFSDEDENLSFLSRVAETSNTQKPIKVKDLIANRIEQKKLQNQYKKIGVFLQLKRGETINKTEYPEKWQFITNDEVAQVLFSVVYQRPGNAKNAKSSMLQNEDHYRKIFGNTYNDKFLLGLQHLKIGFNNWKKKVKKDKSLTIRNGLVNNGYFMFMAVIGLLAKLYMNKDFFNYISSLSNETDFNKNELLKLKISENDIGSSQVFNNLDLLKATGYTINLFEFVFNHILRPVYIKYKMKHETYSYSHLTKSDSAYYDFVVAFIITDIVKKWETDLKVKDFLSIYFVDSLGDYSVHKDYQFNNYRPGLTTELTEFASKLSLESNKKLRPSDILTLNQISKINNSYPRTFDDLEKIGMNESRIKNFGEEIIRIVDKYRII